MQSSPEKDNDSNDSNCAAALIDFTDAEVVKSQLDFAKSIGLIPEDYEEQLKLMKVTTWSC